MVVCNVYQLSYHNDIKYYQMPEEERILELYLIFFLY